MRFVLIIFSDKIFIYISSISMTAKKKLSTVEGGEMQLRALEEILYVNRELRV